MHLTEKKTLMKLLTSSTCAPCVEAKRLLDLSGIEYQVMSVEDAGGRTMAQTLGVRQVPTLCIPLKDKTVVCTGLPKIKEFIEGIE